MKILKVIHGYPPRYSAGSEVYSQLICHGLIKEGHEVVVFTRQEDPYKEEYSIEWDFDQEVPSIRMCIINMAHSRDGYQHPKVDEAFALLIDQYQPDVVHIGHLNHLSTSLVLEAKNRKIPVVFTLHDFWLMCPRGQFLQATHSKEKPLYPVCEGQDNQKCALRCYWRYFSHQEDQEDVQYWTHWVRRRMNHIKEEIEPCVDLFLAPSKYLMNRFLDEFGVCKSKMVYLDYGFKREHLKKRARKEEDLFTFGYIGTHKQAKGIIHLLDAFNQVHQGSQLKIWGRPSGTFTSSLKAYAQTFTQEVQDKIEWLGGYKNNQIVDEVFNQVDAIVVPSIWGENSPLVIHEALEAGVSVITADFGGMKEYIKHEVNGLLFEHRNPKDLARKMKRLIEDPILRDQISKKGYLESKDGRIPSISEHVKELTIYYQKVLEQGRKGYERKARSVAHHV